MPAEVCTYFIFDGKLLAYGRYQVIVNDNLPFFLVLLIITISLIGYLPAAYSRFAFSRFDNEK